MKKSTILLSSILSLLTVVNAQTIVNTGPGNKHVILEEFTGIKCGNCPAGHTEASTIISNNPGVVHVIAYGPSNSSYTDPSGTAGTDFRRTFANAFYTSSYCSPSSGSRFMPSAFINRKLIGGDILQSRSGGTWTNETNTTLTESAPMNVGLKSTYNSTAQTLTIDVEIYYTSTVSSFNGINVMITEDNLTSDYQSGSSASSANPYVYKHTFRENVTSAQWGEIITTTSSGTLVTKQYVFDLTTAIDPINIANAHIVAFIVDANSSNKEVYTGISVIADGGQASTGTVATNINGLTNNIKLNIFPNPSNGNVNVTFNNNIDRVEIFNVLGESIYLQNIENNSNSLNLPEEVFNSKGIYFVKVSNETSSTTERLIIQ